jgi:serine/threonine-protein kinase HipA
MKNSGKVFYREKLAGWVWEDEDEGIHGFTYDNEYLLDPGARQVSFTLPLRKESFLSATMLPFFDGLIPEGWVLDIVTDNWKLDARDRMAILLIACKDCIGAISIIPEEKSES